MTDFYAVLSNALARIGPGNTDQRVRVYGQVRTLMARRLANRQPPLSPHELSRRTEELEAAISRIESEMMLDDELVTERSPLPEPDVEAEVEDLWNGAREAPMPPSAPSVPPADAEAPEAIWGTPAIDLAWDQTTEQWLDPAEIAARPPPAPMRNERPVTARPPIGAQAPRIAPVRTTAAAPRPLADRPSQDPPAARQPRPPIEERAEPRIAPRAARPEQPPSRRSTDDAALRQRGEVRWPRLEPGGAGPAAAAPAPAPKAARPRPAPDLAALDAAFAAAEAPPPVDAYGRTEPRLAPPGRRSETPPQLFIEDRRSAAPMAEARPEPRQLPAAKAPRAAPARVAVVPEPPPPEDDDLEEEEAEIPARSRRPRRSIGRKFAIALGIVAVLVAAWCLYVFIPILFPGSDDPAAPAATEEARVPTEAGALIVIFGGDDRGVFVGLPDNPVAFDTGENGAFARIASSTAGGARARIGQDIAQQLGGHTIRIAIDARGTPGREAITATLRYQRGDVLLDRQTINLVPDFYVWTVDWVIPGGASTGDFLIIEPGIPGDGTALDIRRLTIQILE